MVETRTTKVETKASVNSSEEVAAALELGYFSRDIGTDVLHEALAVLVEEINQIACTALIQLCTNIDHDAWYSDGYAPNPWEPNPSQVSDLQSWADAALSHNHPLRRWYELGVAISSQDAEEIRNAVSGVRPTDRDQVPLLKLLAASEIEDDLNSVLDNTLTEECKKKSRENNPFEALVHAICSELQSESCQLSHQTTTSDESLLAAEHIFRRHGDTWTLRYAGGEWFSMPNLVGLPCIQKLLTSPHKQMSLAELEEDHRSAQRGPARRHEVELKCNDEKDKARLRKSGLSIADEPTAYTANDPVMDDEYIAEVIHELESTTQGIEEAKENNDLAWLKKLEDKKQSLLKYLESNTRPICGSGERMSRNLLTDTKKKKNRIRKAIKDAIKKIRDADPDLGTHLDNSIKLEDLFSYEPDRPVDWSV